MDEHETRHSTDDFPPSPNAGPRMRPLTLDDFKNYMKKDIKPTLSNLKEDVVLLADQVANNKDNISEIRKDITELQQRGQLCEEVPAVLADFGKLDRYNVEECGNVYS